MKITVNILQLDYNLFFIVNFELLKISTMKVGEKYMIKVLGEWEEATVTDSEFVKELYFTNSTGELIFQFECDEITPIENPL